MTLSSPNVFDTVAPQRPALVPDQSMKPSLSREQIESRIIRLRTEVDRRSLNAVVRQSIPPVFNQMFQPARYKGAWGGRGSSKSHSVGRMLISRHMEKPGTRSVCIREVQKSLGQSVKRLLEDIIKMYGLESKFEIQVNCIKTPGDGLIIFQGMQDHTAESIKSLEGFDIAWVEEAQSLSARSLELLRPTIRKPNSEIWFTWNPRFATDPVDQLLRVSKPPRSVVLKVNYKDNPHLPEVLREELEWDQKRDQEKYEHVWLGEYEKHSEARVFKNWIVDDFETPADAAFLFGGDFGFSVDPTVLIRSFIIGRRLFIDQEVYRVGCDIDHTPALYDSLACTKDHIHWIDQPFDWRTMNPYPDRDKDPTNRLLCEGMARPWKIIADSARPETISYIKRHGYERCEGARKGAGSIEEGINFLKTYDIVLHPRCRHTVDEFTHFSFKKHPKTDEIMPVLEDKKNHVIDSARYMVEPLNNATPELYFS